MRPVRSLVPAAVLAGIVALAGLAGPGDSAASVPLANVPHLSAQRTASDPGLTPTTIALVPTLPTVTSPVTLPPPTLPQLTTPPVTLPPPTLPQLTTPPVTLPPPTLPQLTTPPVTLPPPTLPPLTTPPLTLPPLTLPQLTTAPAVPGDAPGAVPPPTSLASRPYPTTTSSALPASGGYDAITAAASDVLVELGRSAASVERMIQGRVETDGLGRVATRQPDGGPARDVSPHEATMHAQGGASATADPAASALCEDRELLAPWLADLICPNVASSPASLFDGLMPVLGATVVALVIAAAVMLLGGLILRRAGRTSTVFDDAPIGREHDEL